MNLLYICTFIENMTKMCKCICACIIAYNLDSKTKNDPSFVFQTTLHFFTITIYWNGFIYIGNDSKNK